MAIRRKYSVSDVQKVIYALLAKLTSATAPWSSWQVVYGYPEAEHFTFPKLLLYVDTPIKTGTLAHQGGRPAVTMEIILGCWNSGGDEGSGGVEECDIAAGHILDLFGDVDVYNTQFTVTLGTATYTNKTLYEHGIIVTGSTGPRNIPVEDPLEYRREVTISLIVTF
ncbi:MAG TPA: hypothetical protein PLG20_08865 [Candidatus Syntrophosphaera sp.]|nr:hypothetical protein [Candidatus Syntrophosphaera sp.]